MGHIRTWLKKYRQRRVFQLTERRTKYHLVYNEDVIKNLVLGVRYVYGVGVEGDIAEFGTMSGMSATSLAMAISHLNEQYENDPRGIKRGLFFDSFEGLPEARFKVDQEAILVSSGIWGKGKCLGLNEVEFNRHVSKYLEPEYFSVYKGWFKDTVPTLDKGQKFALVHVDGDLYESAIDVLDPLFKRNQISPGAMILFDDWNCNAADPNLGEKKAFAEVVEKYKIQYSDAGSYGAACHKFIIHSYTS